MRGTSDLLRKKKLHSDQFQYSSKLKKKETRRQATAQQKGTRIDDRAKTQSQCWKSPSEEEAVRAGGVNSESENVNQQDDPTIDERPLS